MIDEALNIADVVLKKIISENFNIEANNKQEIVPELDEFWYSGVVGVLGIMGEIKGRVIIGIDFELSTYFVKMVYDQDIVTNSDILDVAYEIFNMIVGNTLVECKKAIILSCDQLHLQFFLVTIC